MIVNGYKLKDNNSNASVIDSKLNNIISKNKNKIKYNYCSSRYKDGGQLRLRFLRTAKLNCKGYQWVTDEGTLVYGIIVLSRSKVIDFINDFKLLNLNGYEIEDEIDLSIIQYLKINKTNVINYTSIKTSKKTINKISSIIKEKKIKELKKKYDLYILIVEKYPQKNGIFIEMEQLNI